MEHEQAAGGVFSRTLALKQYELKDHLGNVRVLVSDAKQAGYSETGLIKKTVEQSNNL